MNREISMKRELFVFAGQSNMMGAAVYPPKEQITFRDSYEYLHKPRRFGADIGEFKRTGFPSGEFVYKDLQKAYGQSDDYTAKSPLADYRNTTYFASSMSNLGDGETERPFSTLSEQTAGAGVALPPFVVQGWESMGHKCVYAHIAKGSVSIRYFFDEEMTEEVNCIIKSCSLGHAVQESTVESQGASRYFKEKIKDFIEDSKIRFSGDDMSTRVFFWLQGESDALMKKDLYKAYLSVLWRHLRKLGFTHFFCIRVGWWFNDSIESIIQAQEEFCDETNGAYMLTRVNSLIPMYEQNESKWFIEPPARELYGCRDSFYGFENPHINEKGFTIIAKRALPNMERILVQGKLPILEDENLMRIK